MSFLFKLFASVKTSYIPAALMFLAVMACVLCQDLALGLYAFLFYAAVCLSLMLCLTTKNKKDMLFVAFMAVLYICAEHIRRLSYSPQKQMLSDFVMLLTPIYIYFLFFFKPAQLF